MSRFDKEVFIAAVIPNIIYLLHSRSCISVEVLDTELSFEEVLLMIRKIRSEIKQNLKIKETWLPASGFRISKLPAMRVFPIADGTHALC